MSLKTLFIEAVRTTEELPPLLRQRADQVTGLEESRFDESYIAFLDEQIQLSPRGPEWTERLRRRRAALVPYCGVTLLYGRVVVGDGEFTVRVCPRRGRSFTGSSRPWRVVPRMEPLTVNMIIEAAVTRLEPYGAWIDCAGRTGLVTIPEVSWSRISHPAGICIICRQGT